MTDLKTQAQQLIELNARAFVNLTNINLTELAQAYLDKCEEVDAAIERIFSVEEANSNLQAENERLREALLFYADEH
jgi:N-acetylmuramic acid 6-phosphate (MurNAc-6-P) etherase